MKKILIVSLLILALCLSLFACGKDAKKNNDKDDDDEKTVEDADTDEGKDEDEDEGETEASLLPFVTEASEDTEWTEATEEIEVAGSISEYFAAHGLSEQDLLVHSQDYIAYDEDGDVILYSTASGEDVAKAVYDACKKASDDGEVLDFWTEEPVEFSYEEDQMINFSYKYNGEFKTLWVTSYWEENGYTEYLIDID